MTVIDILDSRRQALVERREWHIRRRQAEAAQHCTSRLDELTEIRTLLMLRQPGPVVA